MATCGHFAHFTRHVDASTATVWHSTTGIGETMTIRMRTAALSILVVGVLALAGCAPGPAPSEPAVVPDLTTSNAPADPGAIAEEEVEIAAATQEETCGWGSGKVVGDAAAAPSGTAGSLDTVIIGAWQHTHFDTGAGYEAVGDGTDVRYVFPSTDRILYCQDVEGATQQAENAANFTLEGTEIVLPSPASGYNVVAWDANTMVWENHRDGSLYLLQRR